MAYTGTTSFIVQQMLTNELSRERNSSYNDSLSRRSAKPDTDYSDKSSDTKDNPSGYRNGGYGVSGRQNKTQK